jgi:uncharacterized protein YdaU (DUF1376 family)
MGRLRWYKRDPRAALTGMRGLTLEECGAYNIILDLIYIHDGELKDDSRFICHELHCNAQRWQRLKARLLDLGKIYMHAGMIRNERADDEVQSWRKLQTLSELSANKRWATYNEIKRLRDGLAMQPTTRIESKLSAKIVPMSKGPPDKKA